jgi:hypothetical protein
LNWHVLPLAQLPLAKNRQGVFGEGLSLVASVVAGVAGTAATSCANWQVLPLEQNPRAKKRHAVEGG